MKEEIQEIDLENKKGICFKTRNKKEYYTIFEEVYNKQVNDNRGMIVIRSYNKSDWSLYVNSADISADNKLKEIKIKNRYSENPKIVFITENSKIEYDLIIDEAKYDNYNVILIQDNKDKWYLSMDKKLITYESIKFI